ncbi:MAG: phosphonate ABC transporter ATP-binding protein [Thermoflexales bacterium]|nr:phosphonate ABC transporter ATP-binding protein [Thermoflexales bacterium]MDW8350462.1 phosphonate ABC transporter ATP-binding protein [Anaerolineae bacterium]
MQPLPIFELRRVTVRYGALTALQDVSLRIEAGERVALIGPSGAGKSTLLGVLNGSIAPTSGEVRLLGQNPARLSARALRHVQRQIGTIYQQFNLVPNLSVIHNVNAGHLGRWSLAKAVLSLVVPLEREAAVRALENVGIADKLYERTANLSGGQQQRVAIARVLVQNPVAILADEPISSVDPERSREIMTLLRALCDRFDKTLVVSLHALEYAYSHCDRIVGLREGRVQFDLPTDQVTPAMMEALYRIRA